MSLKSVDKSVKDFFKTALGKTGNTVAVEKAEKGWLVMFEAVDDPGAGFDPIYGLYEVTLDEELGIINYKRKSLRRRSELEWRSILE